MKIKFVRDALYETEGYRKGHTFRAGEVHEFTEDFAQRWIRRGDAEAVDKSSQFKPLTRVASTATQEPAQPEPEPLPDLGAMTKAELQDLAADRGIEVNASATKAEIIDAIEAA